MKKKKPSPKELREARQKEQSEKRAHAQALKEQELAKKQEEQAAEEFRRKLPPKDERKSLAKAMGLKSTLVIGDTVVMTSFGKGNDAVLEKSIRSRSAHDLNPDKPAFSLDTITDEKYTLKYGRIKDCIATADDPTHSSAAQGSVPQDMLGLKAVLEKKFYGQEFHDDNVHIQVIYNILDIEKILAVYATNAVYAINNLFRVGDAEKDDFVGYLSTKNLFSHIKHPETVTDQKTKKNCENSNQKLGILLGNRRIGYFGQAFYETEKKRRDAKDIYDILALIGHLRQWAFHGNKNNDSAWLYKLEQLPDEFKTILDKVYAETVRELNHDFVKMNAVNLQILQDSFPKESFPAIAKEYYGFLITKKHKNIGFSIKHLREILLDESDLRDKKFDSVRHKLYHLLDFIIYHGYLHEDAVIAEELVDQLRASLSEIDKEKIYIAEAERLSKKLDSSFFADLAHCIKGENIKVLKNNNLQSVDLTSVQISTGSDVSYFTKLIYLLSLFLDGKEINDLLTTLIHKFDNIRVFNETLDLLNLPADFAADYSFFRNSGTIFKELSVLNSFARMSSIDPTARKIMYRDAVEILGIPLDMTDEAFDEMLDKILCYDKNGKKITNADSGMRNFIATNVIESNRFKYLVRYGNSRKIRSLANCESAVRFVLSNIPDEQIIRYYDSCHEPDDLMEKDIDRKRAHLAAIIRDMNFGRFEGAAKVQRCLSECLIEAEKKQRYQAVIRLYLTVMYLLLKNMVNINSRYVMGFHALERDAALFGVDLGKDYSRLLTFLMDLDRQPNGTWDALDISKAETAGCRHLRSKKWYSLAYTNLMNSDKSVIGEFRNTVAHLNAIRNIDENIIGIGNLDSKTGYFEMYHYLIQMHLKAKLGAKAQGKTADYFDNLTKYHTYCRDFVKAYCVPMAYNLPRFKNLTIDGQFDKNHKKEEAK